VDTDPAKLKELPCEVLLGNAEYPSLLEEANLRGAKLLVSALNIEDANILLLDRAHRAGVPASIHAFHTGAVEDLESLGADHLIVGKEESVRRIADELRRIGVLG
jgi:Trk K+ transport system NAD-binding subunit